MGFPDDALTKGDERETVALHVKPHWSVLLLPTFWAFLVLLVAVFGWNLPTGVGGHAFFLALMLAVATRVTLWPMVVRSSTHVVFTSTRILLRDGVFNRKQRDIPLGKLNEVSVSQNIVDQLFGCGALLVGPAGERGSSRLDNIPDVTRVQVLLNQLIELAGHRRGADIPDVEKAMMQLLNRFRGLQPPGE